ncbi:MAG: Rab family GTPase [Candidatus Helarchaeota archaeon]
MQFRFKIVLVGEEAVGKTSLIIRYINNTFQENYIPTLGVNFMTKDIILDKAVRLIIWDIGGQSTWKAKLPLYLKGADGALIVFDLTRPATLLAVEDWIEKINSIAGTNTPFIVIGNKIDLVDHRRVKKQDVEKLLQPYNYNLFLESSAKTGQNVEIIFQMIAQQLIKHLSS